ncbi:hypothetical protein JA9_001780 [Meyerozyma sp. JA9]|nr:hypothetical protein JA9_001780 [Meyerozyma sp. JA9]
MSAYILLASRKSAETSLKKKRNPSSSSSSRSSITSSGSSPRPKRYDVATNSYVETRPSSSTDNDILAYQRAKDRLARSPHYHSNFLLNQEQFGDTKLFSGRNLEILRYTYFEKFTSDETSIHVSSDSSYMNVINCIRQQAKTKRNDSKSDNKSEKFHIDEKSRNDKFHDSHDKTPTVQKILLSGQFWNDIYQDIKFQSSGNINYFDLMPSMTHCQTFFSETFDYLLYHMMELTSPESIPQQDTFVHFTDSDYAFISNMGRVHVQEFATQHQFCSYFRSAPTRTASVEIHIKVLTVLVETIIENLRQVVKTGNRSRPSKVMDLWKHFITFVMMHLIFTPDNKDRLVKLSAPSASNDDEFPSPTIDQEEICNYSLHSVTSKTTGPASIISATNSTSISSPASEQFEPVSPKRRFKFF